jgi:hypothetical protein
MRSQTTDGFDRAFEGVFAVLQPLEVGDVAVGLDRITEDLGRRLSPGVPALIFWLDVEAVVDLNGPEALAIVRQPLCLRDILRVKDFAPMAVLPARRADPEAGCRQARSS